MKMKRLTLFSLFVGCAALAVSSCAYDPYYSTSSYSGGSGYRSGYGNGYGSSNFSTSVFVSTGNPRWGYDPHAGCYYDYTRRSYYDPHLSGYYPVGYRPRYVHGAPHPHGWSRGSGYCPPPSRISSHTITNCDDRAESYRSLGRDWSSDVRVNAPNDHEAHRPGHQDQGNPQPPSHPFFGRDENGGEPSGRAEVGNGSFGRAEMERPSAPDAGFFQNDSPPPSAPTFEAPPQIEMPAPPPQMEMQEQQQPQEQPQEQAQPEAPGDHSSLDEG